MYTIKKEYLSSKCQIKQVSLKVALKGMLKNLSPSAPVDRK